MALKRALIISTLLPIQPMALGWMESNYFAAPALFVAAFIIAGRAAAASAASWSVERKCIAREIVSVHMHARSSISMMLFMVQ